MGRGVANFVRRAEELWTGGIWVCGIPGHSRVKETGLEFWCRKKVEGGRRGSSRGGLRFTVGVAEAEHGRVH